MYNLVYVMDNLNTVLKFIKFIIFAGLVSAGVILAGFRLVGWVLGNIG